MSIAVAPAPSAAARRVASSEKQLAAKMTCDRREREAALRHCGAGQERRNTCRPA
jgi:hypothetical protein